MGSLVLVFAMFASGYLIGVWTACLVLRQRQNDDDRMPVLAKVVTAKVVTGAVE